MIMSLTTTLMAQVPSTSSATGLGKAAADQLLEDGHEVVLHTRNSTRAVSIGDLVRRSAGVVIGDLEAANDRRVVYQATPSGRIDVAYIAVTYTDTQRVVMTEGDARTPAINTLAPSLLIVVIETLQARV